MRSAANGSCAPPTCCSPCPRGRWARIDIRPGLAPAARRAIATTAAGSYVKVVLRLRTDAVDLWGAAEGDSPFTLLTNGPVGCVYLTDGRPTGRDHVVTMLVHGCHARALNGRAPAQIAAASIAALGAPDGARTAPARHVRVSGGSSTVSPQASPPHVSSTTRRPSPAGRSPTAAAASTSSLRHCAARTATCTSAVTARRPATPMVPCAPACAWPAPCSIASAPGSSSAPAPARAERQPCRAPSCPCDWSAPTCWRPATPTAPCGWRANVLERLGVPTGGAIGQIALLGTFTASVIADGVAAPRSPVRSP